MRDVDVVGVFARPVGTGPFPAVVALGGARGGVGTAAAWVPMLAGAGYAALALAYFGAPSLPEALVRIEVETVERAIAWLRNRDDVLSVPVGVMGMSRGSELAFLAGALLDDVGAVVAFAPSGVSWSGLGARGPLDAPAWTYRHHAIPYIGPRTMGREPASALSGRDLPRALSGQALYDEDSIRAAEIPVERTRGPILMISGDADALWLAAVVERRASKRGFAYQVTHLRYPNAGHGGTRAANSRARADSWPHVVEFLRDALSPASGARS